MSNYSRNRGEEARQRYLSENRSADAGDAEDNERPIDGEEIPVQLPPPPTHPGRRNGPPITEGPSPSGRTVGSKPPKRSFLGGFKERAGGAFFKKWLLIGAGVILIIVLLVAAIWYFGTGAPSSTTIYEPTQAPQIAQPTPLPLPSQNWSAPPITILPMGRSSLGGLNWKFYLLGLGMVAMLIFSLLESQATGDFLLLDFFGPWGLVVLFVSGQIYGLTPLFWVFLGAGILAMIIATLWNPSEEVQREWWNRIDTTHWYVLGLALIFIYLMRLPAIPYPTYIPLLVPIVIVVIGAGKEIFRQVLYSLIAIAVGIIPAVLQTGTALLVGLAIEIIIATFGAQQGWVTSRGTGHDVSLGGRKFKLFLAWDIVLFYIAEVVLIGYFLYGNYVVLAIQR